MAVSTVHQGMMCKRAQGKSTFGRLNWKDRFFVLTATELSYWEGYGTHRAHKHAISPSHTHTHHHTLTPSRMHTLLPTWALHFC
jgi:hypothetical protein